MEDRTARVYDFRSDLITDFFYSSHQELMTTIFNFLLEKNNSDIDDEDLVIELKEENICFQWLGVYAHYCFAKGSISEDYAFEIMAKEGKVESVEKYYQEKIDKNLSQATA